MVDQSLKAIFLIRDPIAALNSWINAPKEFDPNWSISRELFSGANKNGGRIENFYGYDAWEGCALLFHSLADRWPDRVRIVDYSRLVSCPQEVAKDLFHFCELDWSTNTREFIRVSQSIQVPGQYSVLRGV